MRAVFLLKTSWLFLAVCLTALFGGPVAAQRAAGPSRPADFLDPAFHRQRRELLRQKMPAHSVAVLFAAPVRNRANDVDYVYHQNPDLYYLTGYDEPGAVLVLFKEPQVIDKQKGVTEALFVEPHDPKQEQWTGRRLGVAGTRQQLKVQYVAQSREFATASIPWAAFSQVFFTALPTDVRNDPDEPADLYDLVAVFRQKAGLTTTRSPAREEAYDIVRKYGTNPVAVANVKSYLATAFQKQPLLAADPYLQAYHRAATAGQQQAAVAALPVPRANAVQLPEWLGALREVKTPEEVLLLRRAILIAAIGQREVLKALQPTMSEKEVQGMHEFVYRKYGAEFEGYPSIVGAGANACVLHYETNDKPQVGTDLLLMDCGAEYHGYTADVTRTAPPSGHFSPEQRQLYELVLAAQEAGLKSCKPGNDFQAPDKAARRVVAAGLKQLGIVKTDEEADQYFPHGTSHYLGLDVHDAGTYGPLQAGNVITVEPGIYVPQGSLCDKKWWNIGVRIEDDVLITAQGYENLSSEAPRTVADVEALMALPSVLNQFELPVLK